MWIDSRLSALDVMYVTIRFHQTGQNKVIVYMFQCIVCVPSTLRQKCLLAHLNALAWLQGISFLDAKNQLLGQYNLDIANLVSQKASGKSICDNEVVDRLIQMRTVRAIYSIGIVLWDPRNGAHKHPSPDYFHTCSVRVVQVNGGESTTVCEKQNRRLNYIF